MHHWPVTTPTQTWQRLDLVTRPEVRLPPRAPGATCLDLVVHSPNPSLPEGPAPGEMTQAPKSLSVVDLGVIKLGLSGYPSASSPPVGWSQVEGSAEQACLRVATMDKLLWEAMAMVGRDIPHRIWVS
jgi:hypothetical protein